MHLTHALATLEHAGLIRRTADFELTYWFKHVLTQETVYALLLRPERRALHRSIATLYQNLFADQRDENLLLLAHHFVEAGENVQAHKFLTQYGERAIQMSAYPEAIDAFQRALALLTPDAHSSRAQVLVRLGDILCRRANFAEANENLETALQEAEHAGDATTTATAWIGLARVASQQGDHVQARTFGEHALVWAQRANDQPAMARAYRQLGVSHNLDGNNALAQQHLQAALELYRALGDLEGTGSALNSLGIVAREENDLERAWDYFQAALALSQQRGDKYATGVRLNNLGVVAEQRGDLESATRYQEQAHALAQEIGDREGAALTEINLGSLALTRGETTHARTHFQHALAETIELNSIPFALYAIAAFAKWEVAQENLVRGAELLSLAFQHPSSTADIPIDFDSVLRELKTKLNEEQLTAAMARGKEMNLRETVREILARTERS